MKPDSIINSKYIYLFIFTASVVCHVLFAQRWGISTSGDFGNVYSPNAIQISHWIKGLSEAPVLVGGEYRITHSVYIILLSISYLLFGDGDLTAMIVLQVILSSLLYVLIAKILIENYRSKILAVVFTLVAILEFNNLQWALYGSPEAIYRFLFMVLFYILIRLFFFNKIKLFLTFSILFFVLLFFTRADTLILFLPIYILFFFAIKILVEDYGRYFLAGYALVIVLLLLIFMNEALLMTNAVFDIFARYYYLGKIVADVDEVVLGVTTIGPVEEGQGLTYHLVRGGKLFFLRVYHFLHIFPPFWSRLHNLYYLVFIVPIYIGTVAGVVRVIKTKDIQFFMYFSIYLSSMILHGLTRVDASHRTTITAITCLIMFAGYGYDHLFYQYKKYLPVYFQSDNKG